MTQENTEITGFHFMSFVALLLLPIPLFWWGLDNYQQIPLAFIALVVSLLGIVTVPAAILIIICGVCERFKPDPPPTNCVCNRMFLDDKSKKKHQLTCPAAIKRKQYLEQARRVQAQKQAQKQAEFIRMHNWEAQPKGSFTHEEFLQIMSDIKKGVKPATTKWDQILDVSISPRVDQHVNKKIEEIEDVFAQKQDEAYVHCHPDEKFDYDEWWADDFNEKWHHIFADLLRPNSLYECYTILELEPNTAWSEVIKKFRELALKHHPDKNKNSDDEYFKTVLSAYQTIRESVKGK
jgi:hypothetical protein